MFDNLIAGILRIAGLKQSPDSQKIVKNTGWLLSENALRIGLGIFIGSWIARYLGPEQFGMLSFAVAFATLFSTFATFGLDPIIVRNITVKPLDKNKILGTAFLLKLFGGFFALCLTIVFIFWFKPNDQLSRWLVGITAAAMVFQAFDVINLYFQAEIQSKYSVWARGFALIVISLVRVFLIMRCAPLIAFAWASLIEIILGSIVIVIMYQWKRLSLISWLFRIEILRNLINDGWYLFIVSIFTLILTRIDQIMIGQILDNKAVGIYAATVRVSEMFYFFPLAIKSSIFPYIIKYKQVDEESYLRKIQKYYNRAALSGVTIVIFNIILSRAIINFLYGKQYLGAATVLSIHIWCALFVCLGSASDIWLMAENLQRYILYRAIFAGTSNILLNLVLIPLYGVKGAALSAAISYGMSVVCLAFFKKTRQQVRMQLSLFNLLKYVRK
ncbi:MAG: flippase [Candidatus Omnitrophica bacterium]|nr:flippase [Candidatus Omnitrophota bacterium]